MRFEWDREKERANRLKHGLSFDEASRLFTECPDYLEIYDEQHSESEDRFIAIGWTERRVIVVAYAEREEGVIRIFSARSATAGERRRLGAFWRGRDGR